MVNLKLNTGSDDQGVCTQAIGISMEKGFSPQYNDPKNCPGFEQKQRFDKAGRIRECDPKCNSLRCEVKSRCDKLMKP